MTARKTFPALLVAAVAAATAAPATLADSSFGQQAAACAQADLGARPNPPALTCTHNGTTMSFPNFGAMVQHMRTQDC